MPRRTFRVVGLLVVLLVAWRAGLVQALLLLPLKLVEGAWNMLFTGATNAADSSSIRSAIFNVTSDPRKIGDMLQDFMHSPGIDPRVEEQFRVYLSRQKIRSFPKLEMTLDWLLHLYWIILPALVFSMLCNVMAHRHQPAASSEEDSPAGSPTHGTTSATVAFRRPSGGGQRIVSRRSSSGSLAVGPSLSRPASSGGLARGLGSDHIIIGGASAGGGLGGGPSGSGADGRKMF